MKLFVCETEDNRTLVVQALSITEFHQIMFEKAIYIRMVTESPSNIISISSVTLIEEIK